MISEENKMSDGNGNITLVPFTDCLKIPPTIQLDEFNHSGCTKLAVEMCLATVKLHSKLPPTHVWTYKGSFPGPTIVVRQHQKVQVEWINSLTGAIPVKSVHALTPPSNASSEPIPQNEPGLSGETPDEKVADLPAWTVVHLHGEKSRADNDGWTENAFLLGQSALYTYENDQRSTLLWYHDHAMGVTRFNVFAGLAGMWIIRDEDDDAIMQALQMAHGWKRAAVGRYLALSHETPIEIPLLIQDRNLDTAPDGSLSGQLLHKVEDRAVPNKAYEPGPMEFFGPYTLVNGTIWPHVNVKPRPYRLRVVNGSNARTYQLVLMQDNQVVSSTNSKIIQQIGTDGGLLAQAVPLDEKGIILAPAERADLIVDFSQFPKGTNLRWVNIAAAPFNGQSIVDLSQDQSPPKKPGDADYENRLPFPQVMEFRVVGEPGNPLNLPTPLSTFKPLTHEDLGTNHMHRLVALVEETIEGMPNLLTLQELEKVDSTTSSSGPYIEIEYDIEAPPGKDPHVATKYQVLAKKFRDTVNWIVEYNSYEAWKIINLTQDTHPFHVHLVQFQLLGREGYNTDAFQSNHTALVTFDPTKQPPIDANEKGWKDTVRVNPNEMVTIAAKFDGYTGRYVYHCHVLEHEDHEMMRPYVVMPAEVMQLMPDMSSHGHSNHSHSH